jgi:hypothetical protein
MHMNLIKKSLLFVAIGLPVLVQAAAPSWTPKDGAQLSFVSRSSGKPSGTLVFNFSQTGDRVVEHRVEHLELSKLLLKAVMDQTTETSWRGQALESFTSSNIVKSTLKDSNETLKVNRQANGKLLAVGPDETHELSADAWPLTLTSRDFVSHPALFDLGRGKVITLSSVSKGMEVVTADGGTQNCERFETKATAEGKTTDAVLWYDSLGRLCAMKFPTVVGTVEYTRISVK